MVFVAILIAEPLVIAVNGDGVVANEVVTVCALSVVIQVEPTVVILVVGFVTHDSSSLAFVATSLM